MLLRRKLMALLMTVMLVEMSAAPALADHKRGHGLNNGHQLDDGADRNKGGGQEHIKFNNVKGND